MKKNLTVSIQPLIAFIFCITVFWQNPAMAQTQIEGSRSGELPSHFYDTRTLSMAGTTIGDLYGRPSIDINAALYGLYNIPTSIQFNSNHNWDTNFMQHDLTLPTKTIGFHHLTTRIGFLHQGFDHLPYTNTSLLPYPDLRMFRAELAHAISISDYLSFGTLHSFSYTKTRDDTQNWNWNYFADVGLAYAPDGPVSYGLVLRGLGHKTIYETIDTGQTRFGSRLARQILEIGVTLRYPVEDRTYMSISFANEKRFDENGLWYKGGAEIIPFSFIYIRAGAKVNFDQSLVIPRFGLGIYTERVQFNYMIAPKDIIGEQFHQIGVTIEL